MDPANYCNDEKQKMRDAKSTPEALGHYGARHNFLIVKIFGLISDPKTNSLKRLSDCIKNGIRYFSDQQFSDDRIVVYNVLTSEKSDGLSVHVEISIRHNELSLQKSTTEGLLEGVCRAVWDLMTINGTDKKHQLSVCLNRYDTDSSMLAKGNR